MGFFIKKPSARLGGAGGACDGVELDVGAATRSCLSISLLSLMRCWAGDTLVSGSALRRKNNGDPWDWGTHELDELLVRTGVPRCVNVSTGGVGLCRNTCILDVLLHSGRNMPGMLDLLEDLRIVGAAAPAAALDCLVDMNRGARLVWDMLLVSGLRRSASLD